MRKSLGIIATFLMLMALATSAIAVQRTVLVELFTNTS